MTDPIQFSQVAGISRPPAAPTVTPPAQQGGKDFKQIMLDSINEVNRLQTEADQGVQKLLTGEANNVAEVFHLSNKAGVAFDLLMEVRNKLTEAYQEIQQMRV